MPTLPVCEPWERQEGETEAAHAAFLAYRDLGPGRSISAAFSGAAGGDRQAPGQWKKWSRECRWAERCAAWDAHLQRLRDRQAEAAAKKEQAEWADRRRRHKADAYGVGKALLDKAALMLQFPLTRKVVKSSRVDPRTGKTVPETTVIKPARWSFFTALQMAETADKIIRLAADMATEVVQAPPPSFAELFFDTSGQLADAIEGRTPAMPEDTAAPPPPLAADGSSAPKLKQPPI